MSVEHPVWIYLYLILLNINNSKKQIQGFILRKTSKVYEYYVIVDYSFSIKKLSNFLFEYHILKYYFNISFKI